MVAKELLIVSSLREAQRRSNLQTAGDDLEGLFRYARNDVTIKSTRVF